MFLAGRASARADEKTIDVHFYCDVLVIGLRLGGLHKQKTLPCNQHSQKAQTCLMQLGLLHSVTASEKEKQQQ